MAATSTTLNARTADPNVKPIFFQDLSGTGAGPFVPVHASADSAGNIITPAQDATLSAMSGAAGNSAPALATGASGLIGWLRKIVDTLTGVISVVQAGSTGLDYSANKPALPNVGANFAASGPFASYVPVATLAANPARRFWKLENNTGLTLAVVEDDGTASTSNAPANASVWAISGTSAGNQGGSDGNACSRGRITVYAAAALTGNQFVMLREY